MNDETTMEDEFIDFQCPYCGEQVSFPKTARGLVQECFNCSEPMVVPEAGGLGGKILLPATTTNLSLRRFAGADWKDLMQLFSNEEFCERAPLVLDGEERITRWLDEDAQVKITTPNAPFTLAAQSLESGRVIGILTLSFSDAERLQAILTLALLPDFVRAGLDVEAARGALGFCFDSISLHRVQGFCLSTDDVLNPMFEKAGLRREGEFVKNRKIGGEWVSTVAYAILREEFQKGAGQ